MFKKLQNETIRELQKRCNETKKSIRHETKKEILENYRSATRDNITALRFEQLKNNKITLKEIKKIALKKLDKETAKQITKEVAHFEQIANAEDLKYASISVSWYRSPTWGYNPSAEMFGAGIRTIGSASGCGYDKLSAATAEAMNNNRSMLKALYELEEKRLKINKKNRPSRREFIGYGSGYGAKPYFEGGVGESCHIAILKKLGYNNTKWYSTKNSDLILINL